MSSKVDVVKAYYEKSWSNPPASTMESITTYMSDDYQSLDKAGNVAMNRDMFMGMTQILLGAFKDFKAQFTDLQEVDDGVIAKFYFQGTHTGDFDLSAMGLGVVPASGKMIKWPEASSKFVVENGKITRELEISGGMEWFLAPLGVKLPAA